MVPQSSKISYVEDDDFVRDAVTGLLRAAGFQTETFPTAESFLELGRPDQASCLILDVKLPGMSGIDLQHHLIELGYRIPTIFVTSHSDERLRNAALKAGAVCFLNKPVAKETFLTCVREALALSQSS